MKDPKQRLQAIGEARIVTGDTLSGTPDVGAGLVPVPLRRERPQRAPLQRALPWALAAILALALLVLIIGNTLRAPPSATRPVRLTVDLPVGERLATGRLADIALAPDGSRLVYVGNHGGSTQLYLRSLDQLDHFEATPIPGTEGAYGPFFSPDGQWVAFFAEAKLKKVSLSGGAPGIWSFRVDGAICIAVLQQRRCKRPKMEPQRVVLKAFICMPRIFPHTCSPFAFVTS